MAIFTFNEGASAMLSVKYGHLHLDEGASAMLSVMEKLWLQSTVVMVNSTRETEMLRISKAEAVTTASVKHRLKSLSTAKLAYIWCWSGQLDFRKL